jgi:uncharacterized protein (TIGR02246 family)
MQCLTTFVLRLLATVALLLNERVLAADADPLTEAADRVAIQQLIVKYAHVYDALDVEGYVSVFAEDAVFTFPGNELKGRAAIRSFITGARQRRSSAAPTQPATQSYHSISNTLIDFEGPDRAHHRSYWQVLSGPVGGPFSVTNMGYYDDVVVKRDGEWLIQQRTIP